MFFTFDIELTQAHYLKHYADTNKTLVLCSPTVPMRPDVNRYWTEKGYNLVMCNNYEFGLLEKIYGPGNLKYIWKSERKIFCIRDSYVNHLYWISW